MKVCKLVGTGGTLEDEINDQKIIITGIKTVLEKVQHEYDYSGEIDVKVFKGLCISEIMKSSRGTLNPSKVEVILNSFLYNI